jgi:glycerate kinase
MAMAEGARRSGGRDVQELPLADGGEGFADVLVRALGGEFVTVTVSDAIGEPIQATYGMQRLSERP